MSPRDAILQAMRANRPAGDHPLPEVPQFLREGEDLRAAFEPAFKSMGGRLVDLQPGEDPPAAARRVLADAKPVCSRVLEIDGDYDLAAAHRPADLADVDYAVLRARLGVAETGSVLFTEAEFGVNALGYLAQHLLVLLDPADLIANLHLAYADTAFHEASYAVFHTGPSATADIEGVLIHGAQGVRSLSLLFWPRLAQAPTPSEPSSSNTADERSP